jgi:putative oxidoreductase
MSVDVGILLLRALFGIAIAAHGSQKLFGWFGGYGLKGTGGFFDGLGFRPGVLFAAAAALGEFMGGLLLVLGLLTPFGAAAVLATMIVAAVSVHLKNGFFVTKNGIEATFLYGTAALALLFTGGGAFSLDAEFGSSFIGGTYLSVGLLVLSVVAAALTLALRQQPGTQESTT